MPRWILILALLLSACNLAQVAPTATPAPVDTGVNNTTNTDTNVVGERAAPCPVTAGTPTLDTPASFEGYAAAFENYLSLGGSTGDDLLATLRERGLIYTVNQVEGQSSLPGGGGVWTADITGDSVDDVLVNISRGSGSDAALSDTALWLYACEGNVYREVAEITYRPSVFIGAPTGVNVAYVQDMNSDGRLDIVYHSGDCGANTCYYTLDVLTWDAATGTLVSLMTEPPNFPEGSYHIEGCCQLVIRTGAMGSVGAGIQRTRTWTYQWDGTSIVQTSDVVNQPATYRFQTAQDATTALDSGDYDNALALYQQVMNDSTLLEFSLFNSEDTHTTIVLHTQALFETMIITASQQGLDATRPFYNALLSSPIVPAYDANPSGESFWLGMGRTFMDTAQSSGDLSAACAAVRSQVDAMLAENPLNGLYWGDFGYANFAPTGQQVCPL